MSETKNIQVPRPLSIEETYARRPRRWWLYTLVVIIVALLMVWSASGVEFKGIATKGSEVARGIAAGLTHPDWDLLFGRIKEDTTVTQIAGITISTEGVPYLLFQTIAIAFLGTLIGGILAIPFSFLACDRIVPKWIARVFRILIAFLNQNMIMNKSLYKTLPFTVQLYGSGFSNSPE